MLIYGYFSLKRALGIDNIQWVALLMLLLVLLRAQLKGLSPGGYNFSRFCPISELNK